jgi:surface glycoprotein (TIGR04207 family)
MVTVASTPVVVDEDRSQVRWTGGKVLSPPKHRHTTQTMTGTNDKIRGLFLAALMVLSVVAMSVSFSGAAAAANQPVVDSAIEYINIIFLL